MMCSVSAACAITVLRTNMVCTIEMPMLLPMLRTRLYSAVPWARMCGVQGREGGRAQGHEHQAHADALDESRPDDVGLRQIERIVRHLPQRQRRDRKADEQHQAQIDLADQAPGDQHGDHGADAGWRRDQAGGGDRIVQQGLAAWWGVSARVAYSTRPTMKMNSRPVT